MPTFRNTFLGGKMSKDIDERLLKDGVYRDALNIRLANSEGSDVGAIEKSYANKIVSDISIGSNVATIGTYEDEFEEKIYSLLKSDSGCYLVEFDINTETTTFVLTDTRIIGERVLDLNEDYLVTGIVLIIDTDNNNRLLCFTDNYTQPKCVNIERAKTYAENGFDEAMVLLIKKPPLDAPTIVLGDTGEEENNIEEKFLQFSYRYKYLDGEYSALAPFSEIAFKAKVFEYDYAVGTNKSMINQYNKVDITIQTGSNLVTDIEVVFKESGNNTIYLIETFNKENKIWVDSTLLIPIFVSFEFTNNKIYRVLPEKELFRLYDNVPLKAKAQDLIENRLVYANYTENYDLNNCDGSKTNIDLSLTKISTAITPGVATKSLKTNRELEICPAYVDAYGRMTTPLSSENNTIFIPHSDSLNQNKIQVTLKHKAPCFAKKYRFFIKQTKGEYQTIVPNLFYQDGAYTWVKLDKKDIDKCKEGDALIIKADVSGVVPNLKYTEILEIKDQERNFLEDSSETALMQQPGLYYKLYANNFNLRFGEANIHLSVTHDESKYKGTFFRDEANYVEPAVFYGSSGQDDLVAGLVYNPLDNSDKRVRIKIFDLGDNITTWNTYQFSLDDGTNWDDNIVDNISVGYPITIATPQVIADGLTIEFASNWGHEIDDYWVISCKGDGSDHFLDTDNYSYFEPTRAYGVYEGVDGDTIYGNAAISFYYKERGDGNADTFDESFTSSRSYSNIEEWWFGDDVKAKIELNATDIRFCRGYINQDGEELTFYQDLSYPVCMVVRSDSVANNQLDDEAKINTRFDVKQLSDPIIFETKPIDFNTDIYYEIGRTYDIDANQNHLGFDVNDTNQDVGIDAEIILPVFNCFSWGNAFESYRIKDKFNSKTLFIDTRPSTTVQDYRQNKRIASLTWSKPYEQTTNYNGLNEFNLALINFKDIDDKYGSIQKLVSYDTDVDVWQEDKVHKALYNKSVLYNQDGSSNLEKSNEVIGGVIAYAGEYGISKHPESLTKYGNYTYWWDEKRGAVLRKGQSGIEVISNFGMKDWFKDVARNNTGFVMGGYDPYFNQYIISLNGYTVTFDEKVKGWTSFHSYIPDAISRVNNRLFTVKDGNIWKHNESGVNNFYGVQYASKVETILNDASFEDSIFKTIVTESKGSWKALLKTNYTNSTIEKSEFNQRESRWFAYIRKNEDKKDLRGVTQGIGFITSITDNVITYNEIPGSINIGDELYQLNGENKELIGTIEDITGNTLLIGTYDTTPTNGLFSFSKKDNRIEGSEVRGYVMHVTLEDDSTEENELFAISSNVVKSYL